MNPTPPSPSTPAALFPLPLPSPHPHHPIRPSQLPGTQPKFQPRQDVPWQSSWTGWQWGKEVIPVGASGTGPEHDRCEQGTGATPVSILQGAPGSCGGLVGSALALSGARQSSESTRWELNWTEDLPACSEIALLSLLEKTPTARGRRGAQLLLQSPEPIQADLQLEACFCPQQSPKDILGCRWGSHAQGLGNLHPGHCPGNTHTGGRHLISICPGWLTLCGPADYEFSVTRCERQMSFTFALHSVQLQTRYGTRQPES